MSDMHALITIKMVAMTLFHKKAQIGPGCNTITIAINITVLLLLLVILMLLLNKDECKSLGNAAFNCKCTDWSRVEVQRLLQVIISQAVFTQILTPAE